MSDPIIGLELRRESSINALKKYLTQAGAEVLVTTNNYELVRFRANGKVSVIYLGKKGLAFNDSQGTEVVSNWASGKGWTAGVKKIRRGSVAYRTLVHRDGDECFFCLKPVGPKDFSTEHLLSIAQGGNNHLANLALSHRECNGKAGHMSVMQKIKVREQQMRRIQPWDKGGVL